MVWGQRERGAALEKLPVLGCMQGLSRCCVRPALGRAALVSCPCPGGSADSSATSGTIASAEWDLPHVPTAALRGENEKTR